MKINSRINKRVNESVASCHKVLVNAIIDLLKSIGAQSCQDVAFGKMLILYQTKGNVSDTIIADRIAWLDGRGGNDFLIIAMGEETTSSDLFLSISNLQVIYDEVRHIVRAH